MSTSMLSASVVLCLAGAAAAQCRPHWESWGGGVQGQFVDWIEPAQGSLGSGLFVGGGFTSAGGVPARNIALWRGSAWESLGSGIQGDPTTGEYVSSMATLNTGTGDTLYVGGAFTMAGGLSASCIASWDGASWHATGTGVFGLNRQVDGMCILQDRAGPSLCIAGSFSAVNGVATYGVARFAGAAWAPIGSSNQPGPWALTVCPFPNPAGGVLYTAGFFSSFGGVPAQGVARWDGVSWTAVGDGLTTAGLSMGVHTLAVFDDGTGPELYAGGNFTASGSTPLAWVARWTGSRWVDVGGGISAPGQGGFVEQLLAFDDGTGPALYACGDFLAAGGVPAPHIARYRRGQWSDLDGAANGSVYAMTVWDDGAGPALYVGGHFSQIGAVGAMGLARWTSCPACYANCDASTAAPLLNINDFLCFQARFAAGDSYANCDGSTQVPVLNVADFVCFQQRFVSGCP